MLRPVLDKRSAEAATYRHWYWSARWRRNSKRFLRDNPLCAYCEREGRVTAAAIVDHKRPHRGNITLFWDEANWQGLCDSHHSSTKQREEKRGYTLGVDADGRPRAADHPWNLKR